MLDKRLTVCADFMRGDRVCDIGTDHAYLVADLLSNGKCKSAIAADINEKPLMSAEKTLKKYGVDDKAETVLSDGLTNINLDGVTDIVIAGMGGELIASILEKRINELDEKFNLILQPMTQHPFLRRWLCEHGFTISAEKAVVDGHHYYTVINAVHNGVFRDCDDVFEQVGMLDFDDKCAKDYIYHNAEKLIDISNEISENNPQASISYLSTAYKMLNYIGEGLYLNVNSVYTMMNVIAPMSILHKGDNSGLLVGERSNVVRKILLCLDITNDVVNEAIECDADVIISHHPVIFHPLYALSDSNPACYAYKNDIACLCFHSPLDMADGGINDIIYDMLKKPLSLSSKKTVLEAIHADGRGYGIICDVGADVSADRMAAILKDVFGCIVVRYTDCGSPIERLAFCSGGGGANINKAIDMGINAYITGDVKHDQWISAKNAGMALFDCGHYHTEVIVLEYLKKRFLEMFPDLDISIAKSDCDPVEYLL